MANQSTSNLLNRNREGATLVTVGGLAAHLTKLTKGEDEIRVGSLDHLTGSGGVGDMLEHEESARTDVPVTSKLGGEVDTVDGLGVAGVLHGVVLFSLS